MNRPSKLSSHKHFLLFSALVLGHEAIDMLRAFEQPNVYFTVFCLSRFLTVLALYLLLFVRTNV